MGTISSQLEHEKFEINQTKIKGSCQSGRKVVTHDSKSDLPLAAQDIDLLLSIHQVTLILAPLKEKEARPCDRDYYSLHPNNLPLIT